MKGIEVIPSARRLIKSLRDMGYDFASAVADIVDNSLEAGATVVEIEVEFDGDNSWVRISDNGTGMSAAELKESMRYGSARDYNIGDLGKFGLGMKTASLSQCQRLVVLSKDRERSSRVRGFCWDLDHIAKTNRWEIIPVDSGNAHPLAMQPLREHPGTVVFWQRLDRILGYAHPYGENARKKLAQMTREIETHVSMVFHRFLNGEVKGRKLRIKVNGNEVSGWDPFASSEANTKKLTPIPLEVHQNGKAGRLVLEPYVLPPQTEFSSQDNFRLTAGPAGWNQQQGFYIYRANRMIQSGGWSRIRIADEHSKLARVALYFSPDLDEAFKINVAKMKVQLPTEIKGQVSEAIKPVVRMAEDSYRSGSGHSKKPASSGMGAKKWSLDEIEQGMLKVALEEEIPIIINVCKKLRKVMKEL